MAAWHTVRISWRMPTKTYQDLIAWQRAMDLVEAVYRESAAMPPEERFGLTAQMRRAAVSVPANIAEGQGREPAENPESSVGRARFRAGIETHAMLAGRLQFLEQAAVTTILHGAAEVGRLVSALGTSLARDSGTRRFYVG